MCLKLISRTSRKNLQTRQLRGDKSSNKRRNNITDTTLRRWNPQRFLTLFRKYHLKATRQATSPLDHPTEYVSLRRRPLTALAWIQNRSKTANEKRFVEISSMYPEQNLTHLMPETLIKFKAHRCNVGCARRYIDRNIGQLSINA